MKKNYENHARESGSLEFAKLMGKHPELVEQYRRQRIQDALDDPDLACICFYIRMNNRNHHNDPVFIEQIRCMWTSFCLLRGIFDAFGDEYTEALRSIEAVYAPDDVEKFRHFMGTYIELSFDEEDAEEEDGFVPSK